MIAPHAPTDRQLVESLKAAYVSGSDVPAIVAVDFGFGTYAITGSHRIAALIELGLDVDDYTVVYDGVSLYADASDAAKAELDLLLDRKGVDFSNLCRLLVDCGVVDACDVQGQ